MMRGIGARIYTNGTAALEMREHPQLRREDGIIPFPLSREDGNAPLPGFGAAPLVQTLKSELDRILEGSEMYCSLKLEDFRGCPYGVFTKRGVAVLSSASALLAIISILTGA